MALTEFEESWGHKSPPCRAYFGIGSAETDDFFKYFEMEQRISLHHQSKLKVLTVGSEKL